MKPIVHGLEQKYKGKLDVLYFDVSDEKYDGVKRKLNNDDDTPHFILLKKDGERVRDWMGVRPEKELKGAIDALLEERR